MRLLIILFLFSTVSFSQQQVLPLILDEDIVNTLPNPVIDLQFNGNITDASATGHTVTAPNSFTTGTDSGRSYVILDGVNQSLIVTQSNEFLTDNFTWVVEFRPVTTPSGFRTIVERNRLVTNWNLINKNSSADIKYRNASSGNRDTGNYAITAGTWYKVVVSVNGTNVRFFMNGVKEFDGTLDSQTPRALSDIYLGGNMDNGEFFNIEFDQFVMYDQELTDTQILNEIYN